MFIYDIFPYLSIFFILSSPVLMIFYVIIIIQRGHDLGYSASEVFFLKRVPIIGGFIPYYLFLKKGDNGINEYDEAINYKRYFKGRHCINISDKLLIFDNEQYTYERYMGKYSIKLSDYAKDNIFSEFLIKNYPLREERIHRTGPLFKIIDIPEENFYQFIKQMKFIVIKNSLYLIIKNFEIFIRKENFNYTFILNKNINEISKELLNTFNFPGTFFEDGEYIYYNNASKIELLMWINNVA
jgi:hypothetical protein